MNKRNYNFVIGVVGDSLSTSIFEKSQFNLSMKEFAMRIMPGEPYGSEWNKDHARQWTITNRSTLLHSGYKTGSKRDKKWVVGYDAPYAKAVDRGTPPHEVPFHKLYEWAWFRKTEIKALKPYMALPTTITTDNYQSPFGMTARKMAPREGTEARRQYDYLYATYVEKPDKGRKQVKSSNSRSVKNRVLDQVVFDFAFWVWWGIKRHGVEPSFFFSDAVYQTKVHAKEIIANALVATGRVKVVS